MPEYEGKVNAPEFPGGMEWLNTDRPIQMKDLRGKVVLLDFWTYCCINCMHVLPDLKKLEHKYKNELVVIGVHSAKFTTEKDTDNIRQAILRYEIEHPVVNDKDMTIWRQYSVHAWPTLYLIDPLDKVIGYASGEGIYEPLDQLIGKVVQEFDKRGLIKREPIKFNLERGRVPASILAFPGKVLADEASKRLFIADSNHNRIVVTTLDGEVQEIIGKGEVGLDDGNFETATFNHPQGMALDGPVLCVADTENHAIRRVDLAKRTVTTIAGTGQQARPFSDFGVGSQVELNSPWDLVIHNGNLYIAMAGPHQLWKMDLKTGEIGPYAGSGREARIDGPRHQAALAQPSGITTDGQKLYFADSEVSSIRSADLNPNGKVETIVGEDLFEFGDRDGKGSQVRLQHPLGVVYHNGVLYVADTYNNKIKQVSPQTKTSVTFVGTGEEGLRDGEGNAALFDEPGGVSVADGKLYIADTNNHVIRVADLKTKRVSTLFLRGIEKLPARMPTQKFPGETVTLQPQMVKPGTGTIRLSLQLPHGYKLNDQAPSQVILSADGMKARFEDGQMEKTIRNPQFPLDIPLKLEAGEGAIKAVMVLYYCEAKKESLCYFKVAEVRVPIKAQPEAQTSNIKVGYTLRMSS
ncbi:MAG: redoxin domain-containing protein [Acidobacteria bacterium]|nr:redoxin domain-containing protein [Acidobacteriota bacterium]